MPIDDVSNVIHKFEKATNTEKKETVNQKNIKPITIIFRLFKSFIFKKKETWKL